MQLTKLHAALAILQTAPSATRIKLESAMIQHIRTRKRFAALDRLRERLNR